MKTDDDDRDIKARASGLTAVPATRDPDSSRTIGSDPTVDSGPQTHARNRAQFPTQGAPPPGDTPNMVEREELIN